MANPLPAAGLRQTINFNRDWRFEPGDHPGAQLSKYGDATWERIGLPHSFSLPYFLSPKFYVGYGWYRKHFYVPKAWQGKRINLDFDGAFQVAEVFVNGQRVGEHKGGYTGFEFDITAAVKPGDNVVAVRVNNLWNPRLAPRAGEHVFSGGIYRDVWLVVTAPLHVTWYGTFVTTPQVSEESGTVNVKTEVVNQSSATKKATVKTRVLDANGKVVAEMQSTQTIRAGATNVFDQTSRPVLHPKLWSPEHPNLYSVKTIVFESAAAPASRLSNAESGKHTDETPGPLEAVDDYTSPLGFRWFKWTAEQGFFLNGEHYYIKGADAHQDHAGWGDAVADSGFYRDVELIKEAGFDFIRGSHYPHAPACAAACDRIGMLFWSENCFWGTGGFKGDGYWNASAYPTNAADDADFESSVKGSLRDMIRINRNHPSIIAWSMCNEVFFSAPSAMPKVRKFLNELVTCSHELDPTRPAAIGGCQRGNLDKLGDIAGYNGDGARLPEFMNPGIPNMVTEYGSTIADRPGKYEPGWGDLSSQLTNGFPIEYPWRSGQALWCAFDHGSIFSHFGCMGMVDYFRLPKRMWYWYRNAYCHDPPPAWPQPGTPAGLRLTADKTTLTRPDGTDDAQLVVRVLDQHGKWIDDSPPVTLTIVSGPGQFPTGPSITFDPKSDIAIRDGEAAIEFRSYYAGKTFIRATSPGLKDATIEITTLGEPKFIPGQTSPVQSRPYVRFTGEVQSPPSVVLGSDNPTLASSESPGHSSNLANDGDPVTFWQAAGNDHRAWWQVDLERIVNVSQTRLMFPAAGNWRYRIEISEDGHNGWRLIADQTQTATVSRKRTDITPGGSVRGRYFRVIITGTPPEKSAAIAEVAVTGTIVGQ